MRPIGRWSIILGLPCRAEVERKLKSSLTRIRDVGEFKVYVRMLASGYLLQGFIGPRRKLGGFFPLKLDHSSYQLLVVDAKGAS